MKAVVLAGGSGTRLHPLSIRKPKPMVRVLDRPLLEHILRFLSTRGVKEVCLTLCYLPELIQDAFGDGSSLGLKLRYEVETEPLGTAGSVRKLRDWLGTEELLLVSGDAALSFDLDAMRKAHAEKRAEVTLGVSRVKEPGEYGLVLTDADGYVQRFTEKPSQGQACTDLVNTGVYLLSPAALCEIPEKGQPDFAKDVFPGLLSQGKRLYAFQLKGYWRDVGNLDAYRAVNRDALRGKIPFVSPAPELRPGVWSASPLPEDAELTPPVYIGENVLLGAGLRLGPDCVIGAGSILGRGTELRDSVIGRAELGPGCRIDGAVLEDGVHLGAECRVGAGVVLAENCVLGSSCVVEPGAVLWPEKRVPSGRNLHCGLGALEKWYRPVFDESARLCGEAATELTPSLLRSLGAVCAEFGAVGAASTGGNLARDAACSFLAGAASGGRDVCFLDAESEASSAFMAVRTALEPMVFVRQSGNRLTLRFFDGTGLPVSRSIQRKLEQARGFTASDKRDTGGLILLTGCEELYAASLSRAMLPFAPAVRLKSRTAPTRALTRALSRTSLTPKDADSTNLSLSPDGFTLTAVTTSGKRLDHEKLTAALCLLELRAGEGPLTVPDEGPEVLDRIAEAAGSRLLRPERDGAEALGLYWAKPWCADGAHLAARLFTRLAERGLTLDAVAEELPDFYTIQKNCEDGCERGELMERLGASAAQALNRGVRLRSAKGSALVSPLGGNAYRIIAESFREEYALELCADVEHMLRKGNSQADDNIISVSENF